MMDDQRRCRRDAQDSAIQGFQAKTSQRKLPARTGTSSACPSWSAIARLPDQSNSNPNSASTQKRHISEKVCGQDAPLVGVVSMQAGNGADPSRAAVVLVRGLHTGTGESW